MNVNNYDDYDEVLSCFFFFFLLERDSIGDLIVIKICFTSAEERSWLVKESLLTRVSVVSSRLPK